MQKNVLLIGASGLIGGELVQLLLQIKNSFEVRTI
jgi:uncharacterized protein YbjT (DUF2867 family)